MAVTGEKITIARLAGVDYGVVSVGDDMWRAHVLHPDYADVSSRSELTRCMDFVTDAVAMKILHLSQLKVLDLCESSEHDDEEYGIGVAYDERVFWVAERHHEGEGSPLIERHLDPEPALWHYVQLLNEYGMGQPDQEIIPHFTAAASITLRLERARIGDKIRAKWAREQVGPYEAVNLARKLNLSRKQVYDIIQGRSWKTIEIDDFNRATASATKTAR